MGKLRPSTRSASRNPNPPPYSISRLHEIWTQARILIVFARFGQGARDAIPADCLHGRSDELEPHCARGREVRFQMLCRVAMVSELRHRTRACRSLGVSIGGQCARRGPPIGLGVRRSREPYRGRRHAVLRAPKRRTCLTSPHAPLGSPWRVLGAWAPRRGSARSFTHVWPASGAQSVRLEPRSVK